VILFTPTPFGKQNDESHYVYAAVVSKHDETSVAAIHAKYEATQ